MVTLLAFLQVIMTDVFLAYPLIFGASLVFIWIPSEHVRKTIVFACLSVLLAKILLASMVSVLLSVIGILLLMSLAALFIAGVQFRRLVVRSPNHPQISARRGIAEISIVAIGLSFAPAVGLAGAYGMHRMALVLGLLVSTVILLLAGLLLRQIYIRARWLAWIAFLLLVVFALRDAYEGVNEVLGNTLP